jgi:hypothetical protein
MKKISIQFTVLFVLTFLLVNAQTFEPIGPGNYTSTSNCIIADGNEIYANNIFINGADIFTFGRLSSGNWNKMGDWGTVVGINCATKIGDDIYVGGHFVDAAGNANMDKIARWNITTGTWHALGGGLNDFVMQIIPMGNDIIVAGKFTDAGGNANADYIAKWDGTSWSAIGAQVISSNSFTVVSSLAVNNNELYVGGNFYASNGGATDYLAKWNGTAFESIPGWNQTGAVYEIVFDQNNQMYIGGEFPAKIAKYNGTSWDFMGNFSSNGTSWISDIKLVGSTIYAGGKFTDVNGIANADNIIKYNGSAWEAVGSGLNDEVYEMDFLGNDLYVAGKFTDAGGNTAADKLVKISLNESTSLNKLSVESNFHVFPNPSDGIFNIETKSNGVFELLDATGTIIETCWVNDFRKTFSIHLPAGMYFLRDLQSGTTKKLIVKSQY